MKIVPLFALSLCALGALAALQQKPETPAPSSTLRWKNGETLAGDLVAAAENEITWKSPFFLDPVRLKTDVLENIQRPQASQEPADPFSVVLRDGSHLYGQLTAITADTVTLKSTRHGELTLKRSEVLRLRRWKGRALVTAGPLGDVGWKILNGAAEKNVRAGVRVQAAPNIPGLDPAPNSAPPPLTAGVGGTLPLLSWNLAAYRDVQLPKRIEIDFRVSATARPEFHLALENGQNDQLHIETWNDDLVVASGWDFQRIRKLDPSERIVPLRVCWDRDKQKFWVYNPEGKLLAEWSVFDDKSTDKPAAPAPGATHRLSIRNKGRDLTLESLNVREWDGSAPVALDLAKPQIELSSGRNLAGAITGTEGQTLQIEIAGKTEPEQIAIDQVDGIDLAPRVSPNPKELPTLTFDDGTLLIGRVLSAQNGSATIALAASEKPLAVKLDGLRQWLLKRATDKDEAPAPAGDELVFGKTTMHGKVVGAGEREVRWLPTGGIEPVRLASTEGLKVTRSIAPEALGEPAPALVYTRSGDVIPATLRGLNADGIEIENTILSATSIPLSNLAAVQFGSPASRKLTDFADAEWRMVLGKSADLESKKKAITLEPGMALGHPSALMAREVQFTLKNDNFAATRVRLFCPGLERARSLNVLISQMGDRLTTGIEHGEGQMGQQQQGRLSNRNTNEFRFVILDKQVELYVDGGLWQTFSNTPAGRAGAGLIIEPASVWGNAPEPVVISKFTSTPAPGFVAPPVVSAETKQQALTVPRFRKELPPKHALIGLNGDVLRGEIEAMTATHFGFRSGLETLRVPRDRVKAVIWLQPPSTAGAAMPAPAVEEKLAELSQPIAFQTELPMMPLSAGLQFLQQNQFGDVQFILPKDRQNKQARLSLHGQTLREVLDEMCAAADMTYKVEPKKRVVFKAGPSGRSGMFSRIYWLPAKAFGDPAAVQGALAAKGIEFPEGASASWEAASGQLTVVNSSANHLKLQEVLKTDFGAEMHEPTHWLQLANGARFGLAVQKFEADVIRGTNPLYGECRVPLAQVYTIDSAPPARNAALQELASWQLVFAREPVLPETGGESSPLLNQDAKTFTLPLVGGGDFDLAKAKGKVVVLDFWATWCGPCIRSLPGLIKAMAELPAERVEFIGVNQGEPEAQVKQFLQTRGWSLRTALDSTQSVGRLFNVEGIPHTVVIAPDGKVNWVHTGYSADGAEQVAAAVKKLLEAK